MASSKEALCVVYFFSGEFLLETYLTLRFRIYLSYSRSEERNHPNIAEEEHMSHMEYHIIVVWTILELVSTFLVWKSVNQAFCSTSYFVDVSHRG